MVVVQGRNVPRKIQSRERMFQGTNGPPSREWTVQGTNVPRTVHSRERMFPGMNSLENECSWYPFYSNINLKVYSAGKNIPLKNNSNSGHGRGHLSRGVCPRPCYGRGCLSRGRMSRHWHTHTHKSLVASANYNVKWSSLNNRIDKLIISFQKNLSITTLNERQKKNWQRIVQTGP